MPGSTLTFKGFGDPAPLASTRQVFLPNRKIVIPAQFLHSRIYNSTKVYYCCSGFFFCPFVRLRISTCPNPNVTCPGQAGNVELIMLKINVEP